MKFLLVAATEAEIRPVVTRFNLNPAQAGYSGDRFDVLITAVGMVATAYALGVLLSKNTYSLVINAGIAGSFKRELNLGEVVNVTEDCFSELGAEDGENFFSIDELGFGKSWIKPLMPDLVLGLREVAGITVNTIHGNENSILKLQKKVQADVETMEGAAFFYACNQSKIPSVQIRAISNYVEKRNRESWKTGMAIESLNSYLIRLINSLQ